MSVDVPRMNAATPEILWLSIEGACPVQGEGMWRATGEEVYFRYRHDAARLEVGELHRDHGVRLEAQRHGVTGDPWQGVLSNDQLEPLLVELVEHLAPVAPGESYRERWLSTVLEAVRKQ